MAKKISVPPKPQAANPPASAADWIGRPENPNGTSQEEPLVRLTFDISESLHRRIKIDCAQRGIKRMATELRRILEEHFPAA